VAELRTALGMMSGTSLDGIDIALIVTDGERISEFGPALTVPYSDDDRSVLRTALREASRLSDRNARPGMLGSAEELVTVRHAEAIAQFLATAAGSNGSIDLVGFHGQTVLHDPNRRLTVQIGDGQALAERCKLPVVWDFRADDVAAGGQGAPLVPAYHRALAETAGLQGPLMFLNVGGVANLTFVGADGSILAFDTGPGNALLDDWTLQRTGEPFDFDGRLAAGGTPSEELLEGLLAHPYFAAPPPKSLDRHSFSSTGLEELSAADGAATLLCFTARAVAASLGHLPDRPRVCLICGGGRRNGELMRVLSAVLPGAEVKALEALGFDGDATEAQAFGFLAVRANDRKPITFPTTTGAPRPLSGGRLSRPGDRR
jgi:anhydro-N-acetylmuramic acid kinase